MEVLETNPDTQDGQFESPGHSPDWRAILLLLAISATLRLVVLCRTEVAARDSIGYIRYALELEQQPWREVLCKNHQHPGYPLTVLAMSYPVRYFLGLTPYSMQLSAQLASGLAAVLLVIPMFLLGKQLCGARVGFWAALVYQFLPVPCHILSDGISEGVFLLWFAWAMYYGCRGLECGKVKEFVLCGVFCGLAYLTRPEGALVLTTTGLILAGMQLSRNRRRIWLYWFARAAALTLPALAIGSSYFLTTGHFTNKPSVKGILTAPSAGAEPRPMQGPLFAAFNKRLPMSRWQMLLAAIRELATEIVAGLHYFLAVPALLGVWWQRRLWRTSPRLWLLSLLCLCYAAVLLALALKAGYISNRHVLIVVMCGTYAAVSALQDWPEKVQGFCCRHATLLSRLGMLLVVAWCLPKTMLPLHYNRTGHHAAGLWLAAEVRPGDEVRDDHCWAHYYAGQVFLEGQPMPDRPDARCFTVINRARAPRKTNDQREKQWVTKAGAEAVFHWPEQAPADRAQVVIYVSPRRQTPQMPAETGEPR